MHKKQNKVFLVDSNKQPLNPITSKQARKLLEKGKAAVFRRFPFTLILKSVIDNPIIYPLTLKLDPGSRFTGIVLMSGDVVLWAAELEHRGQQIKNKLEKRSSSRRFRRSRKTRYRRPPLHYWFRKGNKQPCPKKKRNGWLAPSLLHRIQTIETWVNRLMRFAPVKNIEVEGVRFDLAKMQNPGISGIEYQQGTLYGREVKEYLLEKWGNKCFYCDKENIVLEVEHIHPKCKGGSDRVSNLTIACVECNQKKGKKDVKEFLKKKPEKLKKLEERRNKPLKDAAAVNSTRKKLVQVLSDKLPTESFTGAQTKHNRKRFDVEKTHWKDAACVGDLNNLVFETENPLRIQSVGHGTRQKINPNKHGFPKSHKSQEKEFFGFQTGDIVKAFILKGKYAGCYLAKVAVRKTGNFKLSVKGKKPFDTSYKNCKKVHSNDGYSYSFSNFHGS